jgi:pimeloyl-ACP methyl ester carboxylesterase
MMLSRGQAFLIKSATPVEGFVAVQYQRLEVNSKGTPLVLPEQVRALAVSPRWKEELAARDKDEPYSNLRSSGLYELIDDGEGIMLGRLPVRVEKPDASVLWFNGLGNSWKYEVGALVEVAMRRYACALTADFAMSHFVSRRIELRPDPGPDGIMAEFAADMARPVGEYTVRRFESPEDAARDAAAEFDAQIVRVATSVEFLRAIHERDHPHLSTRPLVVVGCSGGVPAALAFATKHLDRVAAVVLIGGGADLASVYLDTELTDPASRVRWLPHDPPSEQRDRFIRTWLEACTTDPLHTAAAIPADRMLVIQADRDRIVPTATGDRLWERLGRPERWRFHGGHTLLFWRLDGYASDIASWIDAKVAAWSPSAGVP